MPLRHSLAAALVAAIWGFNFVVIHVGLQDVPPLLFVAIRFAVVAVPAVFFVARPKAPWTVVVAIGCTTSLGQFTMVYLAMHLGMPAGLTALVLQAQVVFTVLIAAFALHERPRRQQVIGIAIGALGLVVVGFGRAEHVPALAVLVTLAGALSWGIGNVITRHAKVSSGVSLVVWSALVVPLPALALSLTFEGPEAVRSGIAAFGLSALASTLFTALASTLFAYGLWNTLLARYPAAAVTPFILLVPAVGMTCSAIFLGERPNAAELTGAFIVLAGVALATVRLARGGPARVTRGAGVRDTSGTGVTTGHPTKEEHSCEPSGRAPSRSGS